MGTESQHRRSAVAALGGGMFLLLLALAALNAFNPLPPFLRPHGTGQILLFTALSVIAFLLLLTLLILLFRNIVKLLADQRSRVLGSRIRSRMLVGALLLSFAPAVIHVPVQLRAAQSLHGALVLAAFLADAPGFDPGGHGTLSVRRRQRPG